MTKIIINLALTLVTFYAGARLMKAHKELLLIVENEVEDDVNE